MSKIKNKEDDNFKTLYFPIKDKKIYWYRLDATKYKNYRIVTINYKTIINADISDNKINFIIDEYISILDFLIFKVKWCLKLLKEKKYNDYIENNLPYENRFGIIKRSDYWNIYPNLKRELLNQIKEFVKNDFNKPVDRIKHMTSGKYFKFVKKAYEALNYNTTLDSVETYFKYSNGKDENLSKINPNSSKEFDKWYNDENRFGGHPFEIIRGTSSTRINLYIEKDNGYYLALNGRTIKKNIEIAKIYLALKKEVPIYLYNHEVIKNSLCASDYLGVVPKDLPLTGCNIYFKNQIPLEFIYYNEKFLEHIKWEKIKKVYLK